MGRRGRSMGLAAGAIGLMAISLLVCAALVAQRGGASAGQTALEQLWETPYATRTTMLWNAAEDSQGEGHWGDSDDSSSDERFDTFGHSASGSSSSGADLKDILPSSERDGTSLSSSWGSGDDSNDSNDYSSSDDSFSSTKVHSWDSEQNVKLKHMLATMYHNGIDKISKSVAAEAEKQANPGFFGKWAKLAGKKISKGHKKFGLSSSQAKLYNEAESSEVKESKKTEKLVAAAKKLAAKKAAAAKLAKKSGGADGEESKIASEKHKIQAADKLAAKIAGAKKVKRTEKAKGDAEPKADPGTIGSKSAVHNALNRLQNAHGAAARKAAQKKMAALEQQIKSDFNSVTEFANKVKTSLPPMKA